MDMIRAALYIRVSSEEQVREGYSLEAQRQHLTQYAKQKGYVIVDTYADEGVSARKKYTKRKQFIRLLDDVQAGKIDLILFIKLDRWFRSIADYYKTQEILDKNNVGWRATMEQYDTTSATGRLHINIRLSVAQDEADRTSERIKFVFDRKIAVNEIITGKIPLGFKKQNKSLVVDEHDAEIIRFVFDTYLSLRSKRATLFRVQEEYEGCGRTFDYQFISRTLTNEKYIGRYRGNDGYCPMIIDKKTFEDTQTVLKAGASRVSSNEYLYIFTGLLVCPSCGWKLGGCTGRNYKYNKVYRYYRCNKNSMSHSCDNKHRINEAKLEAYLLDNIQSEVEKYKVSYQLSLKNKKKPIASKKTIETKLSKLKDLYLNDLIQLEDYKKEYKVLCEQLERVQELHQEEKKDFTELEKLLQSDFRKMYSSLNNEARRTLWNAVIDHITPSPSGDFDIFFK